MSARPRRPSRPASPLVVLLLAALGLVLLAGCAGSAGGPRASGGDREAAEPMDQVRLERLFAAEGVAITGPPGAIQTVIDDVKIYCLSDPQHDRMRFIAPIAHMSQLDARVLEVLLQANFHTTLDARYAISDDVVFAAFLHPISSLTPDHLRSSLHQVVSLVRTFGTTFSSGALTFAPEAGSESEPDPEPAP